VRAKAKLACSRVIAERAKKTAAKDVFSAIKPQKLAAIDPIPKEKKKEIP
jgi:hypothetical protein